MFKCLLGQGTQREVYGTARGRNGSASQDCTGDGGFPRNWTGHALALAETDAHVLVHYGRSAREAQSLVESIHSKGGGPNTIRADLATPEGATLLATEARARSYESYS